MPPSKKPAPTKRPQAKFDRRGGLKALSATLPRVATRALGRRGFAEGDLVHRWDSIVGREMAAHCLPVRLASAKRGGGATLTLRVEPGFALELQHLEPLLIERINGFFGYRAVGAITLRQGPLGRGPARTKVPPRPLSPEEESALKKRLEDIDDDDLRDALARLGRSFQRTRKGPGARAEGKLRG